MAEGLSFQLLGPIEVWRDGRQLEIEGRKQKALLALLLLHLGKPMSADRLIDELWGERPPAAARKNLHVHLTRLRATLGEGVLARRAAGYELDIEGERVDLNRFEALADEGRQLLSAGRNEEASHRLREALALWRSAPLAGLEDEPFAADARRRLNELRLAALENRIDADLAAGDGRALVPELEALLEDEPYRERLRAQLMLALYRDGRQAEALALYRRTHAEFVEQLGVEPGPALQDLERSILRHDPSLRPPARAVRRRVGDRRTLVALTGALILAAAVGAAVVELTRGDRSAELTAVQPNSLATVDAVSGRLVGQIPVGARPGAAASAFGAIWVANRDDGSVSRIDRRTRAVVRTISVGSPPTGLAAAGGKLWVVGATGTLTAIDPVYNQARPRADVALTELRLAESRPLLAAFGLLWTADSGGRIAWLDPATGKRLGQAEVGGGASALARGFESIWVANTIDGTVSRVDPTGAVTATIPVGHRPRSLAVGAGAVWVANSADGTIVRIDPSTNAPVAKIAIGSRTGAVAADNDSIWVTNPANGGLVRVDATRNKVVGRIHVGGSPGDLIAGRGAVWVAVTTMPRSVGASDSTMRLTLKDDLSSLDPAFAPGPPEFQLQYMTCAMLLNYPDAALPEGGGLEPEVAASAPRISDGGRTYTFTIRPGFRFSPPSGAPVTAQTFKYTLERALSRRLKSPAALFLADIVGFDAYRAGRTRHLAGVSVRGNQLVIRLRSPAGDLPARLAFPNFCPVPIGTPAEATGIVPPSAGPYYIASYVPDHLILLKRNPNYHGPRPRRPAEIEYRIGLSGDRATAAVAAGRADYVADGIAPEARPRLSTRYGPESAAARRGRQRYFVGPFAGIAYLALNTSRPLFANARLRRAVSYAVDRTALAGEEVRATDRPGIFAGNPFDHYLPPAVPGSPAGHVYPLRPNVAKARALAGRDRRRAVLYTCAEPPCPQEAQILATNLKQIGIDVEIHELPLEVLYSEIFSPQRRYDIVRLRWLGYFDPYDFLNALFAGPETRPIDSVNASRFDSRTWNRQLVAAARLSPPRRYVRFAQLDRMLTREAAPAVVYASYVGDAFFSARIGCQLYQPVYGIDLGRLCIRK